MAATTHLPFVACTQIFLSKEHEKGAYGRLSPGPTTSKVVNSFGTQALSIKKTNPSFGFGTSKVRSGACGLHALAMVP